MKFGKNISYWAAAVLISLLFACKSSKMVSTDHMTVFDTIFVQAQRHPEYRASRTKQIDILHTKLNLAFNWDSAFVIGEASLTIKPYFHAVKEISLDARGFKIENISEVHGSEKHELRYTYDGEDISIELIKEYTAMDTLRLSIKYVAMPDKIKMKGSAAITGDKGMYFINKDGSDPKKPRQLWTQGETESNSCWFPTIDSPNEKFTTEIYVTIEEGQTSISNGLKLFSVENGDGSKTEYWKMDKQHSAYLVMLAVGPFSQYEDHWRDIEVNYFVDSAYLPYAKDIFGHTPEMLEFFSNYLGVTYPWQKYDQVVVHDYVSGAMENTTATIHGGFLQQTSRELLDYTNEDVISHELFHHWFGDLVTCESWSNLTLNEGFATYGEYLWDEYKYGRDEADFDFSGNKEAYFRESTHKQVDLIRFYFEDKEDMFDSHSYAKGGLILHMLRKYVGDEAFRASLKYYLTEHAYDNAEVHDLRMAFEYVTGEDLNWFFNQWFLSAGHPILDIEKSYNADKKELEIMVTQTQDMEKFPVFKLPVDVEVMIDHQVQTLHFDIEGKQDTLRIACNEKPVYVNFDVGQILLAVENIDLSKEEWVQLFNHTALAIDRKKALSVLLKEHSEDLMSVFVKAGKDSSWIIRSYAFDYFKEMHEKTKSDSLKSFLFKMAGNDPSWQIRYRAIDYLKDIYKDSSMTDLCIEAMQDSSIMMVSSGIRALSVVNPVEAGKQIRAMKEYRYSRIAAAAAEFYADNGTVGDHKAMIRAINETDGYQKYQVIKQYGNYLERMDDSLLLNALPLLIDFSKNNEQWWVRNAATTELIFIHSRLKKDMQLSESENIKKSFDIVDTALKDIKKTETRQSLISVLNDYLENDKLPRE